MLVKPYFTDIRHLIMEKISRAEKEIKIAVAWFTDHEIFDALISRMDEVSISLVVVNDNVNNRVGGLDFQSFIDKGGVFYFGSSHHLMHNKYCIIDDKVLVTGSYNYTYCANSTNEENVVLIEDCSEAIKDYGNNFDRLVSGLDRVEDVHVYHEKFPVVNDTYSYNNFVAQDMYNQMLWHRNKGDAEKASLLYEEIKSTSNALNDHNFVIEEVAFDRCSRGFRIEEIVLNDDELIFACSSSAMPVKICSLDSICCWTIYETGNIQNQIKASSITELSVNGSLVAHRVEDNHTYRFGTNINCDLADEEFKLAQEDVFRGGAVDYLYYVKDFGRVEFNLHFRGLSLADKIINLTEKPFSTWDKMYWYCTGVDMRLNRKQLVR